MNLHLEDFIIYFEVLVKYLVKYLSFKIQVTSRVCFSHQLNLIKLLFIEQDLFLGLLSLNLPTGYFQFIQVIFHLQIKKFKFQLFPFYL